MASGSRRMVINTRERAVSTDINRMQAFKDADLSEMLRYQSGVIGDALQFPGYILEPGPGIPWVQIINGLVCRPQMASVDLVVDAGIMLKNDPTYGPDDSYYRFVRDPGVQTLGVLTLTPGGGGVRIDVVECRVVDTLLESENRDIFNPATGLFIPALVDKSRAARLEYRIRMGAVGGGFPGIAPAWTPLMVARVPATATTWNDCDCWDVRPLLKQSWNSPYNEVLEMEDVIRTMHASRYDNIVPTALQAWGIDQRRHGYGRNEGATYPEGGFFDLWDTVIWQPGMALVTGYPWYLWYVYPHGLPGWRKYTTPAYGVRVPFGHDGIPVVSQIAPNVYGNPTLAIPVPTATGLGGSTLIAVVAMSGLTGTAAPGLRPLPSMSDGARVYPHKDGLVLHPATTPAATETGKSTYQWFDNRYYPANARSVHVKAQRLLTSAGAPTQIYSAPGYATISITDPSTGAVIAQVADKEFAAGVFLNPPLSALSSYVEFDLPLPWEGLAVPVGFRQITIDWIAQLAPGPWAVLADDLTFEYWNMTP